ncbi:MAG: pyruvate ferredoxin oxidoreductase [Candidatus Bathyarchaeia archaeon]
MAKQKIDFMTGNEAVAYAVKLAKVQVVGAYPITPQSPVVEKLAEYFADGEIVGEYIEMDGEHSCFQAMTDASAAGARVFSATCGPGLAYAHEPLQMIHYYRLPVVIAVPNRSYISLFPDLTDTVCESTTGFIQLFCENPQELLDTTLQAYKVAEDHRVLLPAMIGYDGYVTSHTGHTIFLPDQEDVDAFLPPRVPYPGTVIDPTGEPSTPLFGFMRGDAHVVAMEQEQGMQNAKEVLKEANEEYYKVFGRRYGNGLIERFMCDDVDAVIVTHSSMTGTARVAVSQLQGEGKRVGLVKLKAFRPFPAEDFQELAKEVKAIGVCERQETPGSNCGEMFKDLRNALYDMDDRPKIVNFIVGLAGADITMPQLRYCAEAALKVAETGKLEKTIEWTPEFPIPAPITAFQM